MAVSTFEAWWDSGPMHHPPCQDEDCFSCAASQCPSKEPLHHHHDGCPACFMPRVVHCKLAKKDTFVYVGRPSKWGNPFYLRNRSDAQERAFVIQQYEQFLVQNPQLIADAKRELRGRNLGCYCAPLPCHADVLLRIANEQ